MKQPPTKERVIRTWNQFTWLSPLKCDVLYTSKLDGVRQPFTINPAEQYGVASVLIV